MEKPSSGSTTSSRRYDASRRQADARARRLRIVETARDLFLERGFGATSIEQVAKGAEVSVQTVYAVFKSKPGLLSAVLDLAVAGDDAPVMVRDRPDLAWYREVEDPVEWLQRSVRYVRHLHTRSAELLHLVNSVAGADPALDELAGALNDGRRADSRLAIDGGPFDLDSIGMTLEEAGDVLATLAHPVTWIELVVHGGWTPQRYEAWLLDLLVHTFVPGARGVEPLPEGD